jgi:hypothetical protein
MPLSTINSNSFSSTANTNIDNGNLFIDAINNRIGMGTTTPVATHHIKGSGTSGQTTSALILENASSGTLGLDITGTAGSSYARLRYAGGPSTGTNAMTGDVALIGLEGSSIGFQQIKFAPTQVASSDPNTLDDYEEGSWTPGLGNSGTATFNTAAGRYVKIGKFVTLWYHIDVNVVGTASGAVTITGFPFSCFGTGPVYGHGGTPHCQSFSGARTGVHLLVPPGSSGADIYQDSGNGAAAMSWSVLGSGNLLGSVSFETNS